MNNENIPPVLFKEKKVKDGWTLNLVKQNTKILSTSLYNPAGKLVEAKTFMTQEQSQVELLRTYIELFEEGPDKNLLKLKQLKVR